MAHDVSVSCPSCGVAIAEINAHTRSVACAHCSNWVYLGSNGWEAAGLFEHAMDAPSMLQLGKRGKLNDRDFVVRGRVRLSYAEGFWDEWWLEFDDQDHQWLEEDDGVYRLHVTINAEPEVETINAATVGGNVMIDGESWFVSERIDAQVAGVEGSLPVAIVPSERVVCIDVMGKGLKMSIECGDNDIHITRSRVIRGAQVVWK